jgi:predicted GH43/DUF377 family glycosyl hydrolase
LPFPPGSFNPGLTALPDSDRLITVYRPDELSFAACLLDKDLNVVPNSHFAMGITNCADPRLVWVGSKLLMVYSSTDLSSHTECIRGAVLMDRAVSCAFIKPLPFRISPPSTTRQKNWMPFVVDGRVYLTASVRPHEIYELTDFADNYCRLVVSTPWQSPWFNHYFKRGNTNPVQLEDGNWLGTFHTVMKVDKMHYYDNGCYVFSGQPPFNVLRCANRTYLRAEDAVAPHFRKAGQITVNFPVGMVRQGNCLLISYGDNDSACRVLDTTVEAMLATTLEVR